MKISSSLCAVTFIAISLLTGCGDSELQKAQLEVQMSRKYINELETQLSTKNDELTRQKDINEQLSNQTQDLINKIKNMESQTSSKMDSIPPSRASQDPSRVEILGAKAVAEFKAEQLSKRVEALSLENEAKQKELQTLTDRFNQVNNELSEMKHEYSASQNLKEREFADQIEKLKMASSSNADKIAKFTRELDEKNELLATLKAAVQDSGKLKQTAENEYSRCKASEEDLQNKLSAATKAMEFQTKDYNECSAKLATAMDQKNRQTEAMSSLKNENEQLKAVSQHLKVTIDNLNQQLQGTQASQNADSQSGEATSLEDLLHPPGSPRSEQPGSASNLY